MRIAVHQMCSGVDPAANAVDMASAIQRAGKSGASFYFAPEMSLLLNRDRGRAKANIFTESETPVLRTIREAACDAAIWVHLGSIAVLHEDGSGRFANRTLVIDDRGAIRACYDKMHMFDVDLETGEKWQESAAFRPGDNPSAVRTPHGLMGLAICYDLRFSVLFDRLSQAGVDLISVPSAFTVPTGRAHWEPLLRARAIETQSFIIAAAQSGEHQDGRSTYGHSLVIGPWGEVIADLGEETKLQCVDLDLDALQKARAQIPVRHNRQAIGDVRIWDDTGISPG